MSKRFFTLLILSIIFTLTACTTEAAPETPPEAEAPTTVPVDDPEPTADSAPPAMPAGEPAVLISEVLTGIEGNNNVEFIELTNWVESQQRKEP